MQNDKQQVVLHHMDMMACPNRLECGSIQTTITCISWRVRHGKLSGGRRQAGKVKYPGTLFHGTHTVYVLLVV